MQGASEPRGAIRIQELSRRSGVSTGLLRAWERRYGLLDPARSDGGYRLYDPGDVALIERMREHIGAGISAAEAAQLTRAEFAARSSPRPSAAVPADTAPPGLDVGSPAPAPTSSTAAAELSAALDRFDDVGAHAAFDRLLADYGTATVIEDAVLPYLRKLGHRWESGEAVIGQEHFASALLRGRLLGLARGWGGGAGSLALLACVPGDQHDLGLICFGLALREHGWRIAFLGPDTPLDVTIEAARRLHPARVVLSASTVSQIDSCRAQLALVAHAAPLAIAGGGARATTAAGVGAIHLSESPVAAAAYVAGRSS